MSTDNILVAVRIRPFLEREKSEKLWMVQKSSIIQTDENGQHIGDPYSFDHIFDQSTSNVDIYGTVVKSLVLSSLEGFNSTIFAYGQTSSGKTFTMLGNEGVPGIMHLAMDDIFNYIRNDTDRKYLLRCSYIEIYNEKINDLLDKSGKDIKIREHFSGAVYIQVKEEIVYNTPQVLELMKEGSKIRKIGCTDMNERSSRSHTIFRIIIQSALNGSEGSYQESTLNLVDLAGSERIAQTKAVGARLKEGVHINKSLTTLGIVIRKLSDGESFINYRDSKLTRLLQHSLGGNAKTLVIAAITVAAGEETKSTLEFAQRAKAVKNQPIINERMSDKDEIKKYAHMCASFEQKIKFLQSRKHELESEKDQLEEKLKCVLAFTSQNTNLDAKAKSQKRRHTIGHSNSLIPRLSFGLTPIREGHEFFEENDDIFSCEGSIRSSRYSRNSPLKSDTYFEEYRIDKETQTDLEDPTEEEFIRISNKDHEEETCDDFLVSLTPEPPANEDEVLKLSKSTPSPVLRIQKASLEQSLISLKEFTVLEKQLNRESFDEIVREKEALQKQVTHLEEKILLTQQEKTKDIEDLNIFLLKVTKEKEVNSVRHKEELEYLKSEIDASKKENSKMSFKLEQVTEEKEKLKHELECIKNDNSFTMEQVMQKHKNKVHFLNEEIESLNKQLLNTEPNSFAKLSEELKTINKDLEQQLNTVKEDINRHIALNSELKKQIKDAEKTIIEYDEKYFELDAKYEDEKKIRLQLENSYNLLQKDIIKEHEDVSCLAAIPEEEEEEKTELSNSKCEQNSINLQSTDTTTTNCNNTKIDVENKQIHEKNELSRINSQLVEQLEDEKRNSAELSFTNDKNQSLITRQTEEIAKMRDQLEELLEKHKTYEHDVEIKDARITELENLLESQGLAISLKIEENKKLSNELEEIKNIVLQLHNLQLLFSDFESNTTSKVIKIQKQFENNFIKFKKTSTEVINLREQLKNRDLKTCDFEKDIENYLNQLHIKTEQEKKLMESNCALQKSLSDTLQQISELEKDFSTKHTTLEEHIFKLSQKVAEAEENIHNLKDKIVTKTERITELENTIAANEALMLPDKLSNLIKSNELIENSLKCKDVIIDDIIKTITENSKIIITQLLNLINDLESDTERVNQVENNTQSDLSEIDNETEKSILEDKAQYDIKENEYIRGKTEETFNKILKLVKTVSNKGNILRHKLHVTCELLSAPNSNVIAVDENTEEPLYVKGLSANLEDILKELKDNEQITGAELMRKLKNYKPQTKPTGESDINTTVPLSKVAENEFVSDFTKLKSLEEEILGNNVKITQLEEVICNHKNELEQTFIENERLKTKIIGNQEQINKLQELVDSQSKYQKEKDELHKTQVKELTEKLVEATSSQAYTTNQLKEEIAEKNIEITNLKHSLSLHESKLNHYVNENEKLHECYLKLKEKDKAISLKDDEISKLQVLIETQAHEAQCNVKEKDELVNIYKAESNRLETQVKELTIEIEKLIKANENIMKQLTREIDAKDKKKSELDDLLSIKEKEVEENAKEVKELQYRLRELEGITYTTNQLKKEIAEKNIEIMNLKHSLSLHESKLNHYINENEKLHECYLKLKERDQATSLKDNEISKLQVLIETQAHEAQCSLKEKDELVNIYKADSNRLETQVKELTNEMEKLIKTNENIMKQLNREIDAEDKKKSELENLLSIKEKEVEENSKEIKQLQNRLRELEGINKNVILKDSEISQLRAFADSQTRQINAHNDEKQKLEYRYKTEIQKLEMELTELQEKLYKLAKTLETTSKQMRSEIAEKDKQVHELSMILSAKDNELRVRCDEIDKLQNNLLEQNKLNDKMKLDVTEAKIVELEKNIKMKTALIEVETKHNKKLQDQISELTKKLQDLEKDVHVKNKKNHDLENALTTYMDEIARSNNAIERIRCENTVLKENKQHILNSINRPNAEVLTQKNDKTSSLLEENKNLKDNIACLQTDITNLKSEIEFLDKENNDMLDIINDYKENIKELDKEIEEKEKIVKKLQERILELETRTVSKGNTEVVVNKLEQKIQELVLEINGYKIQLKEGEKLLKSNKLYVHQLQSTLKSDSEKLLRYEKEIDALKNSNKQQVQCIDKSVQVNQSKTDSLLREDAIEMVNLRAKLFDLQNRHSVEKQKYVREIETLKKYSPKYVTKQDKEVQVDVLSAEKYYAYKDLCRNRRKEGNILRAMLGLAPDVPVLPEDTGKFSNAGGSKS